MTAIGKGTYAALVVETPIAPAPLLDPADLARCAALDGGLAVTVVGPDADGWLPCSELLGPSSLLRERLDAVHHRWGTPDRRVDASFAINAYAWFLGLAGLVPFLVSGRVPDLDPANLAVRLDEGGEMGGIALRSTRTTGADLDDLRLAFEGHLEVAVERLRLESPIGRRALWSIAADSLAAALLAVGDDPALGRAAHTDILTDRLLRSPGSPLRWAGSFLLLETAAGPQRLQARGSCCLNYRIAGEDRCDSCPLRPPVDRLERLRVVVLDARVLD